VNYIDWQRKVAYVEATDVKGRSRWKGEGHGLGHDLCQAIRRVLASEDGRECWSRRATERIRELRHEFSWVQNGTTAVVCGEDGRSTWWNFAGFGANATIANELSQSLQSRVEPDSLSLEIASHTAAEDIEQALRALANQDPDTWSAAIDERAVDGLKFSECIPGDLAITMLADRIRDSAAARQIFQEPVRFLASDVQRLQAT
jgi:ATP-dependent helicase Lhr and Lhr-like helicase